MSTYALVEALLPRYSEPMNMFPSLPEDTRRAASTLYGNGNLYLRLGDQANTLLENLFLEESKNGGFVSRIPESTLQCALLTVFQYIEELANQPMLEALRSRVDLRYALHLPLNSPSLNPQELCEFRQQLLSDPARLSVFQKLLDRLTEFGLFTPANAPANATQLLTTVCTINRFEDVVDAMYRVLETLALVDPDWLRRIAKPYWYDRYNRRRKFLTIPISDPKWNVRVLHIGADIRYLLGQIDQSNHPHLASLEEIKEIRKIWNEQYMLLSKESDHRSSIEWGLSRCATCKILSDVNYPSNPI